MDSELNSSDQTARASASETGAFPEPKVGPFAIALILFSPPLLWGLLIGVAFQWGLSHLEAHVQQMAIGQGRFTFEMVETFRLWNARHGGLYGPVNDWSPPNPYLDIPERDITTPSGLELTRINPAYMTRQLAGVIAGLKPLRIHITSLDPVNPINRADPWETDALRRFVAGEAEEAFQQTAAPESLPGTGPVFRYMAPLPVRPACLACHAHQGYRVGDIRGGISVTYPAAPFLKTLAHDRQRQILIHGGAWLLLSAITIFALFRLQRQVIRLRQNEASQTRVVRLRTRELSQEILFRRQSEERFRSVTQTSNDAIIATDSQGRVAFWNNGAERMFGYSETQMLDQPLLRIIPESLRETHRQALNRFSPSAPRLMGAPIELTGLRADGTEFPLEISLSTWKLEDQRYFSAVIRDISERKAANARMAIQSAALRSAANAILLTNVEGHIEWVNPAFCRLTGYSEAEALGQNPSILKSGQHQPSFYKALWETILGGSVWSGEITNRKRDGSLYIQESIITPVRNAQGEIDHFIAIQQDITERKKAEQERFVFQQAVEQSPITTVITDPTGGIEYVNPKFEEVTGYSREEALGANPRILKTEETDPKIYQGMWKAITAGEVWRGELLNQRKNAERFWESVLIAPIRDVQSNEISHFMALKEDITERKRTEQALQEATRRAEEASQAKSAFLATMSHEIRTPINSILGMGEVLLGTELSGDQKHFLEIANNAGESLLALVNDILDLSKIESGQLTLELQPLDLHNLVDGSVQILGLLAAEQGLELTWEMDPATPVWIEADGQRLRQVLLNLIGNAIKFTPQGSVHVAVGPGPDGGLLFAIRDTGIGIAPNLQEAIFQPFTQADASTTRRFGGTGLGLSICRRLIEKQGGRIWVESVPGKGSTFLFTLHPDLAEPPAQTGLAGGTNRPGGEAEAGASSAASPDADGSGRAPPGLSILLADDSADNQLLIQTFLRGSPHHIVLANNGQEALEAYQGRAFDLVLMDMQMPVMDGYTATRRIRDWERAHGLQPTVIAALTAHAMSDAQEAARTAGCDHFLSKPIRKKSLIAFIDALPPLDRPG